MAQTSSVPPGPPGTIGLIGGLAFRAGVYYYDQILQRFNPSGLAPDLILRHADVKKVLAYVSTNDKAELGSYLGTLANELADAGATFVAVTAVAPHLAVDEISQVSRIPVVNVLDALAVGINTSGVDRVAVFGNRAVVQTNIFGALSEERAVKLQDPMLEEIHAMYTDIALNGKRGTRRETDRLSEMAHEFMEIHGASAIVLAGTDLSSFYADQSPDYPFLDMAQLHIDQIVSYAMTSRDR
jgi:aspartate racemase